MDFWVQLNLEFDWCFKGDRIFYHNARFNNILICIPMRMTYTWESWECFGKQRVKSL